MSKKYNLENRTFGDLYIISKAPKDKNQKATHTKWICKCKCGNEIIVPTCNLINGHTTRCRKCGLRESGLKRRKSYVGLEVGKLKVIEMIYPNRDTDAKEIAKALCKCECGNEVVRSIGSLLAAKKALVNASCGCNRIGEFNYNYKSMTNKKYGRLLVVEEIWDCDNYTKPMVRCKCDCGNDVIISRHDVLCSHTQSCGCLQRERISESRKTNYSGYISDSGVEILYPTKKNKKNQQLWRCKCFCGNTFEDLPIRIKNNHTQSCGCGRKSIKEKIISDFLLSKDIDFIPEYTYEDCKNKYVLRFDFAILNKDKTVKCLIEYDGQQHFKPVSLFGDIKGYEQTIYRDNIKNQYCKDNNIPLLRLPYYLSNDEIKEKILNTI